ncbi:MAG: tRNA (adenosine(37)-N6)-threonylcarbamoyltransferase complex ATPase subunit type 1 TsaE [Chloroflexi bacterium]|nr:tRNA (adenosine(37)-N6)-threonylcarbamoyltransferase complex ATPase subunit type 1 TsaE [Chloroflexota bacterium]
MIQSDTYLVVSESEAQTEAIGRSIGEVIQTGDALYLHGVMGAGKTCLTRGIALGAECEVSARSPTFIILGEYPGRVRIFHCDLYRIDDGAEAYELALDETLDRGALVVEWPENAQGELPNDGLTVQIATGGDTARRRLSMSASGPRSDQLLGRIRGVLQDQM